MHSAHCTLSKLTFFAIAMSLRLSAESPADLGNFCGEGFLDAEKLFINFVFRDSLKENLHNPEENTD